MYSDSETSTDHEKAMNDELISRGFIQVSADETGVAENSFVVWVSPQSLQRHATHTPVRTATRDDP